MLMAVEVVNPLARQTCAVRRPGRLTDSVHRAELIVDTTSWPNNVEETLRT